MQQMRMCPKFISPWGLESSCCYNLERKKAPDGGKKREKSTEKNHSANMIFTTKKPLLFLKKKIEKDLILNLQQLKSEEKQ